MSSFQLAGLAYEPFADYFLLSDAELRERSMRDAAVGEELLLLPYAHQGANTPYKATGPIFVRRGAERRMVEPEVVPDYVATRLMSLRAYDARDLMIDAAVCEGGEAASVLSRLFRGTDVAYVHLHNAKRGCFSCCATRAPTSPR